MPIAEIVRSDLQLDTGLKKRLWTVFHDIPRLYENLLSHLGPMGLTTADVRTDAGDGTLAGFNVQFWMVGVRLLVRIRLDRIEFRWNQLTQSDVPQFVEAVDRVLSAVAAAGEETTPKLHEVSASLHIALEGLNANDLIQRLVPAVPEFGPGPLLGTGIAMYFGPYNDVVSSSLGLEPSVLVPSGLFARLTMTCEGNVAPRQLQERVESQIDRMLRTLGFDWKRGS